MINYTGLHSKSCLNNFIDTIPTVFGCTLCRIIITHNIHNFSKVKFRLPVLIMIFRALTLDSYFLCQILSIIMFIFCLRYYNNNK